jgi:hypothetical protein
VNKIDKEYLEYVADMLKQIRDELRCIRQQFEAAFAAKGNHGSQ